MSRVVFFHDEAENELNEAAGYYDREEEGLGAMLVSDVESAVDKIIEFPEAAPLIKGRVRSRILLKFPYSVIYSVRDNAIRILAIAHQKRRPFYWQDRH